MDLGLSDRVAVVVGGTGYIGSAIAARLREEGATVLTASRSGDADLTLDGSDAASIATAVAKAVAEYGRIDVLVVSAATAAGNIDPATTSDPDAVLREIDAKAMTFLRVAQAVLPGMQERGWGRIVGIAGQGAYTTGSILGSTRNAALMIAAKNLADANAGSGVTVNTVNPGAVVDDPSGEIAKGVPGPSSPTQIAALVAFLASEPAAAISGEAIATGHRMRGIASY